MMRYFRAFVCVGLAAAMATAAAQGLSNAAAQDNADATAQDDALAPTKPAPCMPIPTFHQVHIVKKNRPYSGVRVITCEKRLADGTVFKAKRIEHEWRDAEGRTRYSTRDMFPEPSNQFNVSVYDPVKHVSWSWTEGEGSDKTAVKVRNKASQDFVEPEIHRNILRDGNQDPPIIARMLNPDLPGYKQVILKPTYINGVWSEGDRTYSITKPGIGNNKSDHNELSTNEFWVSMELEVEVRSLSDDPEQGKTATNLVNIDQTEPDPALFLPPADYQVLDATPKNPVPRRSPLIIVPATAEPE